MQLELTPDEADYLMTILDRCYRDLTLEIVHTDQRRYRDMLEQQEQLLLSIRDKASELLAHPTF